MLLVGALVPALNACKSAGAGGTRQSVAAHLPTAAAPVQSMTTLVEIDAALGESRWPGEAGAAKSIADLIGRSIEKRYPPEKRPAKRDAHPKAHGCVRANLAVNAELPKESEAPLIKVATITIPKQAFDSDAQMAFCDNLSFTPWHALPEHRPLGGVNRVRRTVYEQISKLRHDLNQAPRKEPTGDEALLAAPGNGSRSSRLQELVRQY